MELVLVGEKPLVEAAVITYDTGAEVVIIDATRLTFACPLDLAGVVAVAHWASESSMPVTLTLPQDPKVTSYLQRMDVLRLMPSNTRLLGLAVPETRTDQQDRLLEVTHVTSENVDGVAERLGQLVTAHYANLSLAAGRVVSRACGELLDNAVSHGTSETGAFLAAQTYTGSTTGVPRLEFAVCDTGVGVLNHLHNNPAHSHIRRDEIALQTALQAGVSGVDNDRGNGLSDLIKDTSQHGSIDFRMRSGRGEVQVVGSVGSCPTRVRDQLNHTAGAWAWLTHRPTRGE